MSRSRVLALATVLCAAALPAATRGGSQTAGATIQLSNESTFTRWATPTSLAQVRTRPSTGAHRITRLRYQTEDGYPEVYVALQSVTDAHGTVWVQVRVPRRPNGTTGWVPQDALGPLNLVHTFLTVNRGTLRATLYRNGRKILTAPVGVGKSSTPTPAGHFWVRERLPNLGGGGVYGPWAFGTSAYSRISDWPRGGVVGIHGTNQPGLVPGRPSHGCIRVHNRDISRLARLMPIGTPVHVL
jgi:lipoprotein-anchoring transpeptidase ErfK/SrfK